MRALNFQMIQYFQHLITDGGEVVIFDAFVNRRFASAMSTKVYEQYIKARGECFKLFVPDGTGPPRAVHEGDPRQIWGVLMYTVAKHLTNETLYP